MSPELALNVVCCETATRLELGAKRNCQARAQNVADDPTETWRALCFFGALIVLQGRGG
jgi:hypothetical protein